MDDVRFYLCVLHESGKPDGEDPHCYSVKITEIERKDQERADELIERAGREYTNAMVVFCLHSWQCDVCPATDVLEKRKPTSLDLAFSKGARAALNRAVAKYRLYQEECEVHSASIDLEERIVKDGR